VMMNIDHCLVIRVLASGVYRILLTVALTNG